VSGATITAWVLWGSRAGMTIRRVEGEPVEGEVIYGPGTAFDFYVGNRLHAAVAGQWATTLEGARELLRVELRGEAERLRKRAAVIDRRIKRLERRSKEST
jgi:hypothetical protein